MSAGNVFGQVDVLFRQGNCSSSKDKDGGEEQLDRTAHSRESLAPYPYEAIASTVACILW